MRLESRNRLFWKIVSLFEELASLPKDPSTKEAEAFERKFNLMLDEYDNQRKQERISSIRR
jgi:hypothetical protein